MADQGDQWQEGIDMDVGSMAQDENTVEDTPMQEHPPQPNSESEMGAVAEVADERPPRTISSTDRMMEMFEALMGTRMRICKH